MKSCLNDIVKEVKKKNSLQCCIVNFFYVFKTLFYYEKVKLFFVA